MSLPYMVTYMLHLCWCGCVALWHGQPPSAPFVIVTVSFDSYKLQVDGQLMFASNRLADVSIRRSDCLGGVSLWAPRLVNLSLQACYALESVELLADHPLKAGLPESHAVTTNIPVNLVNACVTPEVQSYLEAHPRVGTVAGLEGDDTDYSNGDPMFAMQSMFAQMHRGGNVFG